MIPLYFRTSVTPAIVQEGGRSVQTKPALRTEKRIGASFRNYFHDVEIYFLDEKIVPLPYTPAYTCLAHICLERGNYEKALSLWRECNSDSTNANSHISFYDQSAYYKSTGDFLNALSSKEKEDSVNRSMDDSVNTEIIANIDKDMEGGWQQEQSARRTLLICLCAGLLLAVLTAVALFFHIRQRRNLSAQYLQLAKLHEYKRKLQAELRRNGSESARLSLQIREKDSEIVKMREELAKQKSFIHNLQKETRNIQKRMEEEAIRRLSKKIRLGKEAFERVKAGQYIGEKESCMCFLEYVSIYHPELQQDCAYLKKQNIQKIYAILLAMRLSTEEISTVMGVCESTVRVAFSRIKKERDGKGRTLLHLR